MIDIKEAITIRNVVIAVLFTFCSTFMWRQMDRIDAQDKQIAAQQQTIMELKLQEQHERDELKMQLAVLNDNVRMLVDHLTWTTR